MSYLEELLPEFRKGAKIRCKSWKAAEYIYIDNKGSVITEKGNAYILDSVDFNSEYWEFYKEPETDWQYIIDHKCLCWFWDDDESEKIVGILINIEKDEYTPFLLYGEYYFEHCRPVRRDEVTFYEDRNDD